LTDRPFDALVIGGGLVGLAFANLMARQVGASRPSFSVGVIDTKPPADEPPTEIGLRVSALSLASRSVLETCGVWAALPAERVEAYRRMLVWHAAGKPQGPLSISFDAADQGEAELGYIVDNELVRWLLWRSAQDNDRIRLLTRGKPVQVRHGPEDLTVTLDDGTTCRARLLVGADGASSWVREQMLVLRARHDYAQLGIVLHVATERQHEHAARQRFLPAGPVALLPLADGRCSVVWSCADTQARLLLSLPDAEFGAELTAATDSVLGSLRVTTPRAGFPLLRAHADRYCGPRYALIGDAAHQVHPLAGQGANLGFLDAAALAQVLAEHMRAAYADPGDPKALRRFERWRRGDNQLTLWMMDALHRLFSANQSSVPRLGGIGLSLVDRTPPLKRRLAEYAMGKTGDLPRAARVG
jgi:2-octaprenylphenol hydroxylase